LTIKQRGNVYESNMDEVEVALKTGVYQVLEKAELD